MEEALEPIQRNIISFCKYLETHVEKWRTVLQEAARPAEVLCNQADQLRHVENAQLKNFENFEETQQILQFNILNAAEEEIAIIKRLIEQLNRTNQELKSKLSTLEQSSLALDWDEANDIINGTATQPKLSRILGDGLEFWLFFKRGFQNINENFKNLNLRDEKAMRDFEKSFKIDLNEKVVRSFLALTQYVDNEKAVV